MFCTLLFIVDLNTFSFTQLFIEVEDVTLTFFVAELQVKEVPKEKKEKMASDIEESLAHLALQVRHYSETGKGKRCSSVLTIHSEKKVLLCQVVMRSGVHFQCFHAGNMILPNFWQSD